jgi:hypothetical protein
MHTIHICMQFSADKTYRAVEVSFAGALDSILAHSARKVRRALLARGPPRLILIRDSLVTHGAGGGNKVVRVRSARAGAALRRAFWPRRVVVVVCTWCTCVYIYIYIYICICVHANKSKVRTSALAMMPMLAKSEAHANICLRKQEQADTKRHRSSIFPTWRAYSAVCRSICTIKSRGAPLTHIPRTGISIGR